MAMIKNLYKKILFLLQDRPLPKATKRDQELIENLLRSVERLPDENTSDCLPSEKQWKENVNRLKKLMLTDDPREFLRWDVLTETMVVGNDDFVLTELNHLKQDARWNERWSKAIHEVTAGRPKPFYKYPLSSANLIHHAHHIAQFEKRTGARTEGIDFVVEFGAGYGNMCRLFYTLGYTGTYIMYDLPIFSELQKYFLQCNNIPVYTNGPPHPERTAVCTSSFDTLQEILSSDNRPRNTLFLAMWSISEVPLALREKMFSLVSDFSFFLIGYQNQFGEVDNIRYFNNITKQLNKNIAWSNFPLEHQPGNNFLIGARR
jgi:hypothetical protein